MEGHFRMGIQNRDFIKNVQKSYLVKLSIFYKSGSIRIKLTFPWTDRLVRIESNGTDR